jgi:hypothetical protein
MSNPDASQQVGTMPPAPVGHLPTKSGNHG